MATAQRLAVAQARRLGVSLVSWHGRRVPTLPTPRLLVITDRKQAGLRLPELADRLFSAGLRWLSLREKDLPHDDQVALALELVASARRWDALVMVHGDPSVARASGASGVHLPAGGDPAEARRLLGPQVLVGISAHGEDELHQAGNAGADYATISPVFPSASKPGTALCSAWTA